MGYLYFLYFTLADARQFCCTVASLKNVFLSSLGSNAQLPSLFPSGIPTCDRALQSRVENWLASQQTRDLSDEESITHSSVKSEETASSMGSNIPTEPTWAIVTSLPKFLSGKKLYEVFSANCAGVKRARKVKGDNGCGEVKFTSEQHMQAAVQKMNNTEQFGRKIHVQPKPLPPVNQRQQPQQQQQQQQQQQTQQQQQQQQQQHKHNNHNNRHNRYQL